MPESAPTTFGSYRLLEAIGEGGMGRVWKAMDLNLERVVALKVLKGDDETRRKALIQEAKTACQLNHPNIAVIYDAGDVDGSPFIAMELVEGRSLCDYLGAEVAEADLREMLFQAAAALQHAHQRGIVHRDIKPENLLVTSEGTLKILDFGVAKRSLPHARDTTSSGFTVTEETAVGISVGTPAYMSPEQAYGLPLGPPSDQFSLGTVLFEIATGRHPFRRENLLDTLHAIAKDPAPDLRSARPDLSPVLRETLRRMLEKKPEERFSSMQSLLDFLASEGLTRSTGKVKTLQVPSLPRRPDRLVRLAAAGLGLLGILGLAWWLLPRPASSQGIGRGRKVVAILPIEMLGVSTDRQWVGTSLQDAMASGLLRRGDLLVLDRVRVAEALGKIGTGPERMGRLAAELDAELLVLGTLQSAGDRFRLNLRMVKGKGGEMLNSLLVQGDASQPLALEEDLVRHLRDLFGASASGEANGPVSKARSPKTRELYARAVEFIDSGRIEGTQEAVRLLDEATQGEPGYAPVRAALAWALLELGGWETHMGKPEAKSRSARAVDEARKAVELDPSLPMAHRVFGQALLRTSDLEGARRESQRAVDLDPGDFRAWIALADAYAYGDDLPGRRQAREHYGRALELHPADWWANFRQATLLQNDGELVEAVKFADRSRALRPSAEYAHLTAAVCLLWMGDYPEAARRLEEGIRESPASGLLRVTQALLDFAKQDAPAFREHSATLLRSWPEDHPVSVLLKGLGEGIDGNPRQMEERFTAFAAASGRRSLPSLSTGERRTASVNAYNMARALAQAGRLEAAKLLLAEAERLHPGKLKVAGADPLLRPVR